MNARVPQQTTILGAAKLTGHVGQFSVGALNAVTADEQATLANGTLRTRQSVEPLSSYSVVRARREFANQSTIGFVATATNRHLSPFTQFLPGAAFTGGVDWDVRLKKRYAVQGYWAGSAVRGSETAIASLQENTVHSFQRPDATYLGEDPTKTSLNGNAGFVSFSKIGGSKVRFNSNVGFKSPGFDINDVGFLRRADMRSMSNWTQWRNDTPSTHVRSVRFNLNQWGSWNFGGDRLDLGGNVNAHWVFANNWSTGLGINKSVRGFDDRATRGGGPGAYTNPNWSYWQYLNSDERKAVSLQNVWNVGGDPQGQPLGRRGPEPDVPRDLVPVDQRRRELEPQHRELAVDREHGRPPLHLRPPRSDDRVADRTSELHDHPAALRADLRRAVCLGGRLHQCQAARERPRRALRGSLYADRL